MLVGVCGDDSALWGYGRKPPLTHILPHYHVTWRTPAAPPLGDAFDLAHPPLPVLRTGAARRLLKALCTFWEGCCCCRLRATGNAITPSPRDGGSYRVALQQYKSFWQDSTLDLCSMLRSKAKARLQLQLRDSGRRSTRRSRAPPNACLRPGPPPSPGAHALQLAPRHSARCVTAGCRGKRERRPRRSLGDGAACLHALAPARLPEARAPRRHGQRGDRGTALRTYCF